VVRFVILWSCTSKKIVRHQLTKNPFISMNVGPIAMGIFSLSIGTIAYESVTKRMERNGARRGQIRHLVVVHFEKKSSVINLPRIHLSP